MEYVNNQYAVLITAIMHKDRFYDLLEYPEDIFTNECFKIFKAMKHLHEHSIEIDIYTLTQFFKNHYPKFNTDILINIYNQPTTIHFKYVVESLLHERNKDLVSDYAEELFKKCKSQTMEYKDFLDEVINIKDKVSEQFNKKHMPLKDEMYDLTVEKGLRYYKTGIKSLDDKIVGLFQGRFIIIAASPGSGKSTLARQISYKRRFLFFSLEMTKHEILANQIMQLCGIESWKILVDKLDESEKNTIAKVKAQLEKEMMFTVIDEVYDIHDILTITKAKHKRGEIDGVIIDYIQLVNGAKGDNQNLKIAFISRSLKQLAQQLKIPVIGLSQFSRESDKNDRPPELTDLRDSGSLEQDANMVIFLYTKKADRLGLTPPIQLIVAKNRGGKVGAIKDLVFKKAESRIAEIEETYQDIYK